MTETKPDIKLTIDKLKYYIYICTLSVAILLVTVDLFTINQDKVNFAINLSTIFILVLSLLLFLGKTISISLNYILIAYLVTANIIITNFISSDGVFSAEFMMRDSITIILLLPLVTIVANGIHNIIIGALFCIFFIVLAFHTKNHFLINNIFWAITIVGGFSTFNFFLFRFINFNIKKLEILTNKIFNQNTELSLQAKNLQEINKLLSQQTIEIKSQQNQLEKLNSTKDKFFSLIAHDLKTPLNSIIGFSELISIKYDKLNDEKKKRYIELIHTASKNTSLMLENLLEWSLTQSENISYKPGKHILNKFIVQVVDLLDAAAKNKKITLEAKFSHEIIVLADKHMLIAVLRNLVSNAIKYTPEKGSIDIIAEESDNKVKVSITDTGIGMSQEQIDSLFKIEKNKSTAGTLGEKGTGLGLIICNDFLLKHGSQLKVESKLNEGSTFSFDLQLA